MIHNINLIIIIPIQIRVFQILFQNGFICFEILLQYGHNGRDIGEDDLDESQKVETHADDAATASEFDGVFGLEVEEVSVGVGGVGWSVDPAVNEFDEDEGASQTEVPTCMERLFWWRESVVTTREVRSPVSL